MLLSLVHRAKRGRNSNQKRIKRHFTTIYTEIDSNNTMFTQEKEPSLYI